MNSMIRKFKEDKQKYNKQNTNEQAVLDAHFFSSYKGTLVLKLPIGKNAFSFGIIGIGHTAKEHNLVRHEYGHRLQLKNKGFWCYAVRVAIPSVTANILNRMGKLPYDYYGAPWEYEADILGEVEGRLVELWPQEAYGSYRDLVKLFFTFPSKKKK